MGVLLIIPPAPSIAHTCRQSIDREMFAEEELLENPDDSNCASTKTPRTRSRKRTRSGQSMSDTPERRRDNDKEVASAQPLGKTKMLNKKERSHIVTSIKKCTMLEEITKYFQKCDSSIFDELVSRKDILPSMIEFHRQTLLVFMKEMEQEETSTFRFNSNGMHFIVTEAFANSMCYFATYKYNGNNSSIMVRFLQYFSE